MGQRIIQINWDSEFEYDGDPAHRGHAGLLLMRALHHAGPLFGFGPSAGVRPLLAAAGFAFVPVHRYVTVIRSAPYLTRLSTPVRIGAEPVIDAVLRMQRSIRLLGAPGVELRPVDRFDERIRRFEAERGDCAFYRDDIELNWVLSRPWLAAAHRYLAFLVHAQDEVVGFALARIRRRDDRVVATVLRTGLAADRIGLTHGLVATLFRHLAISADVVELYTNQENIATAARRLGMRRRGGLELSAKLSSAIGAELREADCELGRMPLEFGEGDVIFA